MRHTYHKKEQMVLWRGQPAATSHLFRPRLHTTFISLLLYANAALDTKYKVAASRWHKYPWGRRQQQFYLEVVHSDVYDLLLLRDLTALQFISSGQSNESWTFKSIVVLRAKRIKLHDNEANWQRCVVRPWSLVQSTSWQYTLSEDARWAKGKWAPTCLSSTSIDAVTDNW